MKNNSLLLFLFVISVLLGCRKDNLPPKLSLDNVLANYEIPDGVEFMKSSENASDRDYFAEKPVFPTYDGTCRLVFKITGTPYGPPCGNGGIVFRGYSQPNGGGTLLFTIHHTISSEWGVINIPQSAYIMFEFNEVGLVGNEDRNGPCRFSIHFGDYGWNYGSTFYWTNIPFGQALPVIVARFAPVEPSESFTWYDYYLCDSWCTWEVPIYFTPEWESLTWFFHCYYGPETNDGNGDPQNPRHICSRPVYTGLNQTQYLYPLTIDALSSGYYRTKAVQYSSGQTELYYNVLGNNDTFVGPAGWGLSPFRYGTGNKCSVFAFE